MMTTLVTVNAPTLMAGWCEVLTYAEALQAAGAGCGVSALRDDLGQLLEADPDPELPPGVIETTCSPAIDPWAAGARPHPLEVPEWELPAELHRQLLELLAHVNPDRDILATADAMGYLPA